MQGNNLSLLTAGKWKSIAIDTCIANEFVPATEWRPVRKAGRPGLLTPFMESSPFRQGICGGNHELGYWFSCILSLSKVVCTLLHNTMLKNKQPKTKRLSCLSRARLQNSHFGTTIEMDKLRSLKYYTYIILYTCNVCLTYWKKCDSI